MLALSRYKEEGIYIIPRNSNFNPIYIKIIDVRLSRGQVKIGFNADKDLLILRDELIPDGQSLENYIKSFRNDNFENGEGI